MTPFDLPSGNLFDLLHADLCRPAEVREHKTYLSKPPDEHPHRPHPHYVMSTLRRTSSSASAGSFSKRSPAQRNSKTAF